MVGKDRKKIDLELHSWRGEMLSHVSGNLASDELVKIMNDNSELSAKDLVAKMVEKMTTMFDDMGPDQLIEQLCVIKQQPNENVRDFRSRFVRLMNSMQRADYPLTEKFAWLFFLVKLKDWKEIKAFKPDDFDSVFDTALDLEGKNNGKESLFVQKKKGWRPKCSKCGKYHYRRECWVLHPHLRPPNWEPKGGDSEKNKI